jgi:hypothetical protein
LSAAGCGEMRADYVRHVKYKRDNVTPSERRERECTQAGPGQLHRIATCCTLPPNPRQQKRPNSLSATLRFVDGGWGREV